MSSLVLNRNPPSLPWSRLVAALRKGIPAAHMPDSEAVLRQDLERLATAAPHVLPDIGFVRDVQAGSPHRTVWRKGPICVTIATAPQVVSVVTG